MEITQDTNPILKNSPEAIKFRRNLSTLTIYGAGVIVFGFWNIIKVLGFVLLDIPLFTPGQLASIEPEERMIQARTQLLIQKISLVKSVKALPTMNGKS